VMGRLMTRGLGWSWWWHFYDMSYWIRLAMQVVFVH